VRGVHAEHLAGLLSFAEARAVTENTMRHGLVV
jgi:hypothetical protein